MIEYVHRGSWVQMGALCLQFNCFRAADGAFDSDTEKLLAELEYHVLGRLRFHAWVYVYFYHCRFYHAM